MSYFVLTPNRLARLSSASRAIFGHIGSDASAFGPRTGARRSPRPYLQTKLKLGKLSRLQWPFIRPQLLEGRAFRTEEERRELYEIQFDADRDAEDEAEAEREGRLVKKEAVPLKKGRKKKKE